MDLLENLRKAVCGDPPSACAALQDAGVARISVLLTLP